MTDGPAPMRSARAAQAEPQIPSAARFMRARTPSRFAIDNLGAAWLLLLIGSFSFTYRSASDVLSGQLNASNLVRYACIVVALALITPELRHRIGIRLSALWLFVAYAGVCVLSTVWSVAPIATLGKAAELAVAVATVVLAANRGPNGGALEQLFKVTFAFGVCVLSFIAVGYVLGMPDFWIQSKGVIARQMNTWFLSANYIGYLSALTAIVALDRAMASTRGRTLNFSILALSLMTAVLAQGRTGLTCLLVGTSLVLVIRRKYMPLLIGGACTILLALVFSQEIVAYLMRGEPVGSLQSLTGRTGTWQGAWQSFMHRPLTGNGFGVGGRHVFATVFVGSGEDWSSVHNGLMELLTGVGLVGFAPWIVALLWTMATAVGSAIRGRHVAIAAVTLVMPVITTMSSGAAGWFDIVLAYFLCCLAILAQSGPPTRRAAAGRRTH